MAWTRADASRTIGALLAATLTLWVGCGRAAAATGSTGSPVTSASPAPTTTLPPLPTVDPSITAGQPAASLLANADTLSSVGTDQTAVLAAIAATQKKLDADAVTARAATAQADAAARTAQQDQRQARASADAYQSTTAAARAAVTFLYTSGPESLVVDPSAGRAALYAQAYAESTVGPYGVLAARLQLSRQRAQDAHAAQVAAERAAADQRRAEAAVADQQHELARLQATVQSADAASSSAAGAIAADHAALTAQAGHELVNQNALEFATSAPLPAPVSTTPVALAWAFAELGKPYLWGATGPDQFDCSGLTQFVWKAAGVQIPRVAADQDAWTVPVPLSQLLPGDLVFFGTSDIHHVGIYIGDGLMINAPHTGTVVQVDSIWWSDLAGFGRVHYPGTPVPPHDTPTPTSPAPKLVIAPKPVPAQTAPPPGWTPQAGQTTPILVPAPAVPGSSAAPSTTSTTVETAPPPPPPVTVARPTDQATTSTTSTTSTTVPGVPAPAPTPTSLPG